ncbi:sugar phosphate nucleotidyltransferase [Candidatus Latescibacterota bacterium]
MKAIIPMAGAGTRLRPLTYSKPKSLLRVGSKPILGHIVDRLVSIGCDELVLIISGDGMSIPEYVKEHYSGIKVEIVIQEEQLGLGHAVSLAEHVSRDSEIIIVYGDSIIDCDLSGMVDASVDGVIAVKEVEDPRRFGVVNHTDGIITKFVEKPKVPESNLAIIGFNYIRQSDTLFDCLNEIIEKDIKTRGEFQITDAFQLMIERGVRMKPLTVDDWFDAGTPLTMLETNRFLLKKDGNTDHIEGSIVIPPVYVSESAVVKNSIIGPDVSIGDNAVIERSLISDSIIDDGASVTNSCLHGALIGDNAAIEGCPAEQAADGNVIMDISEE